MTETCPDCGEEMNHDHDCTTQLGADKRVQYQHWTCPTCNRMKVIRDEFVVVADGGQLVERDSDVDDAIGDVLAVVDLLADDLDTDPEAIAKETLSRIRQREESR